MGRGDGLNNKAQVAVAPRRSGLTKSVEEKVIDQELVDYRDDAISAINQLVESFPLPNNSSSVATRASSSKIDDQWARSLRNKRVVVGDKTWRVITPAMLKVGQKEVQGRHWFDVALESEDRKTLIPINLKAYAKSGGGNAASTEVIAALLSDEMRKKRSLSTVDSTELMTKIAQAEEEGYSSEHRDYFFLAYDKSTSKHKVLSLLTLDPKHLRTNPANGLQIDWQRASADNSACDKTITIEEGCKNLAAKTIELFEKRANPYGAYKKELARLKRQKNRLNKS
jgi:hypothetical protein